MTVQLTKHQITEINALLATIGYEARKVRKPRNAGLSLSAWKPETPAGRACKSTMLWYARLNAEHGPIGSRPSRLVEVLAMFGARLNQVQPWPEVRAGHYGPALANAMANTPKLLTYVRGQL